MSVYIVLLGAPGSGKGTQAHTLSNALSIPIVSTGDSIRDQIRKGSELGRSVQSYMERGELVPDELVVNIYQAEIQQSNLLEKGFISDGFPRTRFQAEIGRAHV